MGPWAKDSISVAHMESGDFYGSEQSTRIDADKTVSIEFVDASGETKALKEKLALLKVK